MKKLFFFFFAYLFVSQSCNKPTVPVLSTSPVISSGSTNISGGTISSDGGSNIISKGVCWSISTNPTINNDTTLNGNGNGTFTSEINDIQANTNYYLRAYATNSVGTGYGNELSFNNQIDIGQTYQGGIIFYLDSNGGGLIAAPNDQASSAEWGCFGTEINGADGSAIGTGYQNTIDIQNTNCQTNISGNLIASDVCANLTLGGYSDWYLPSKDELNMMYENIGNGNALGLGDLGNFAMDFYWTSTEIDSNYACKQIFSIGVQGDYCKFGTYYVRAIRSF